VARFLGAVALAALAAAGSLHSWSPAHRPTSESGRQRFEAVEPHMGTLVRITVYAHSAETAREAFGAAFARIRHLDDILSDYRPSSELNRLAAAESGREVPVSGDLFTVLAASQELAEASGGAFDITQGPVIRLWRDAARTRQLPDSVAQQNAAARTGFRKLHLDPARRTAKLDMSGMALDVGGIGKGYAADQALAVLDGLRIRSALVAVSGDLAFSDAPPGRKGWRIRIYNSASLASGLPQTVELTNAAVSTAGSSEQHADIGGRRYSHIVDPSSRSGLVEDLTVTVIARRGLEADGLDTAVSVLGVERGLALVESRPGAAALIVRRAGDRDEIVASSRMRSLGSHAGAPDPIH
jgi:thiamine biosynthesis lipoprotein